MFYSLTCCTPKYQIHLLGLKASSFHQDYNAREYSSNVFHGSWYQRYKYYYYQGLLYKDLKDKENAKYYFQKCKSLNPKFTEVQKELKR